MITLFDDRLDAGNALLRAVVDAEIPVDIVLALPRGGVPVAAVIANALEVPLDLAFVRKIGVPGNPELALAAVSDGTGMKLAINENIAKIVGISTEQIREMAKAKCREIEDRRKLYCGDRPAPDLAGKHVLVVDDGMATGATARAALELIRQENPASLNLAVPIASPEALKAAQALADTVICLDAPAGFSAVGAHYRTFDQTSDDEVKALMRKHPAQE